MTDNPNWPLPHETTAEAGATGHLHLAGLPVGLAAHHVQRHVTLAAPRRHSPRSCLSPVCPLDKTSDMEADLAPGLRRFLPEIQR